MAAPNIVGIDLQLGLRVDLGPLTQEQIGVGLLAICFLRVRSHDDPTTENPPRRVTQDALIQLAAGAVGDRMVDRGLMIDMPLV